MEMPVRYKSFKTPQCFNLPLKSKFLGLYPTDESCEQRRPNKGGQRSTVRAPRPPQQSLRARIYTRYGTASRPNSYTVLQIGKNGIWTLVQKINNNPLLRFVTKFSHLIFNVGITLCLSRGSTPPARRSPSKPERSTSTSPIASGECDHCGDVKDRQTDGQIEHHY